MAGSKRIQWGLLSTAKINKAVIEPIRRSKKSQLLAVASRSQDRATEYAKTWEIPRFYGSYEAMLADPDIDVIYNSLPNSLHAEWSIKAMQMGKHVLCEKPLTTTVNDVDAIIAIAHETGKVVTEAFMYRHHPQTLLVKQIIDQGQIGKLQLIRGSFCYIHTRPNDPRYEPGLGGGCLWDVGCYPVSYARYLLGEEPVEVFGQQVTGATGVDLFFAGQIRFPGGAISQFECSFITPARHTLEITGETGRIIVPDPFRPENRINILLEKEEKIKSISGKGEELYRGEIRDIEEAVLQGKPTLVSLDDSRGNVATLEALYLSAKTGKPIHIQ
jgi:xylose dehydrogenase (NAD/NADP)